MKNKYWFFSVLIVVLSTFMSCDEDSWLQRDPKDRLTDGQLWNDANMIKGLLANYYDRIPKLAGIFDTGTSS